MAGLHCEGFPPRGLNKLVSSSEEWGREGRGVGSSAQGKADGQLFRQLSCEMTLPDHNARGRPAHSHGLTRWRALALAANSGPWSPTATRRQPHRTKKKKKEKETGKQCKLNTFLHDFSPEVDMGEFLKTVPRQVPQIIVCDKRTNRMASGVQFKHSVRASPSRPSRHCVAGRHLIPNANWVG